MIAGCRESLHTKIILGNPGNGRMREYVVQVDTGSAHTWVHCVDSPTVVSVFYLLQALAFGLVLSIQKMCLHCNTICANH